MSYGLNVEMHKQVSLNNMRLLFVFERVLNIFYDDDNENEQ